MATDLESASTVELRLREEVEAFTVSPSGAAPGEAPVDVVLVPAKSGIDEGFRIARELLGKGRAVRLVGDGVTCAGCWPDWALSESGLLLTELGAYHSAAFAASSRRVRGDMEAWLDEVFEGVVPGLRGSEVFFGSAANRLLQPILEGLPALLGLAELQGGARFHCSDRRWIGVEQLRLLVGRRGGRLEVEPPPWWAKGSSWALAVLGLGGAAVAGAAVDQIRIYLQSRPSLRRLEGLRARAATGDSPSLWVVLAPDWQRINQHVLDAFVLPELARGRHLGVLFFSSLRRGLRSEADMRRSVAGELWAGLGALRPLIDRCTVDQVVGPESVTELLGVVWRSSRRSLGVLRRLGRASGVESGSFRATLSSHLVPLVKLATQDLFKGIAAEVAVAKAVARQPLRDAPVIFAGSSSFTGDSVADLGLQRAGAVTVDFFHGTTAARIGDSEGSSMLRCVWTKPDAASSQASGHPVLVLGMPRSVAPAARARPRATNVLLLSNYAHRDSRSDGRLPYLLFQEELVAAVPVMRAAFPGRFSFRWRPHPADSPEAVHETRARHPGLELSSGHSLEEDVHWSHLIVATLSSATIEALTANVPIFIHFTPKHRDLPAILAFDPSRRFFRAGELRGPFEECIAALDANRPDALAPEERARSAFFRMDDGSGSFADRLHAEIRRRHRM